MKLMPTVNNNIVQFLYIKYVRQAATTVYNKLTHHVGSKWYT